jgi:hypothetical protein
MFECVRTDDGARDLVDDLVACVPLPHLRLVIARVAEVLDLTLAAGSAGESPGKSDGAASITTSGVVPSPADLSPPIPTGKSAAPPGGPTTAFGGGRPGTGPGGTSPSTRGNADATGPRRAMDAATARSKIGGGGGGGGGIVPAPAPSIPIVDDESFGDEKTGH